MNYLAGVLIWLFINSANDEGKEAANTYCFTMLVTKYLCYSGSGSWVGFYVLVFLVVMVVGLKLTQNHTSLQF